MEWLNDVWEVYSSEIVPILITALSGLFVAVIIWIKGVLKVNIEFKKMELDQLKKIEEREDLKPHLEELKKFIELDKKTTAGLADLIGYVFLQTDLQPEVKNTIENRLNSIKNEDAINNVIDLEKKLKKAEDIIKSYEVKLDKPKLIKEEVKTKVNKIRG